MDRLIIWSAHSARQLLLYLPSARPPFDVAFPGACRSSDPRSNRRPEYFLWQHRRQSANHKLQARRCCLFGRHVVQEKDACTILLLLLTMEQGGAFAEKATSSFRTTHHLVALHPPYYSTIHHVHYSYATYLGARPIHTHTISGARQKECKAHKSSLRL